jgi:hypothetical protein
MNRKKLRLYRFGATKRLPQSPRSYLRQNRARIDTPLAQSFRLRRLPEHNERHRGYWASHRVNRLVAFPRHPLVDSCSSPRIVYLPNRWDERQCHLWCYQE